MSGMDQQDNEKLFPAFSQPDHYEIRLIGHLPPGWSDWFDNITITANESGETIISGSFSDQSSLHGLLTFLRNKDMVLLSVRRVDPLKIE